MNGAHPFDRGGAVVDHVLGALLLVTAAGMLLPIVCSLLYGEDDLLAFVISAPMVGGIGWLIVSGASALPFMIHGSIPSFTDAFFEMMSGYTTTGSTILTDIEWCPMGCFSGAARPTLSVAWASSRSPSFCCHTAWAACACFAPNPARVR